MIDRPLLGSAGPELVRANGPSCGPAILQQAGRFTDTELLCFRGLTSQMNSFILIRFDEPAISRLTKYEKFNFMRVAVISAEAVPYSKTGGLGDVAGALPKALNQVGVDSVLITPCYLQTKGEYLWNTAVDDLNVDWLGGIYPAKAFYSEASGSPTFLIDAPSYFHRDSIYGYRENHERFAFFNHAALTLLKRIGRAPDIVHLNDWHCGFAAAEAAHARRWDSYWRHTHCVFDP